VSLLQFCVESEEDKRIKKLEGTVQYLEAHMKELRSIKK